MLPARRGGAAHGHIAEELPRFTRDTNADSFKRLIALTYTFCWFGKIHPFLDGNGHVQRAIFAAMATDFGYPLSARFAIHPRPYDRLLATALEIFTRAPTGREDEELGLVAEYLAFFLDGPFNAPRKHVGNASPYAS
ncbi:MAG: Fic family protein [Mesorhizobium sp.]|nr:MAG: Fic family protein [Mesorhizobium sp.]